MSANTLRLMNIEGLERLCDCRPRPKSDGTTRQTLAGKGKPAADRLDTMDVSTRLVLTWNDQWDKTAPTGGSPFKWADDNRYLSTTQKTWMQTNPDGTAGGPTKGQQRLNYIRGDRSMEAQPPTTTLQTNHHPPFPQRQGDIIALTSGTPVRLLAFTAQRLRRICAQQPIKASNALRRWQR